MPKAVYATVDDVQQLRRDLEALNSKTEAAIAPAVNSAEQRLQAALARVADSVASNASTQSAATDRMGKECNKYTDQCVGNLNKQLSPLFPAMEEKIEALRQTLQSQMNKVQEEGKHELARTIEELALNMSEELSALKQEFLENLGKAKTEMGEADKKQREEVDNSIKEAEKKAAKLAKLTKENGEKNLDEFKHTQAAKDKAQDEYNQNIQNDIFMKLGRHDDLLKENFEKGSEDLRAVEKAQSEALQALADEHGAKLRHLDTETEKMRNAVAEVENVSTKRVDWVIKDVSKRIRPNSASKASLHRSWFSPKFNVAGAHGVQLELQLYRPSEFSAKDEDCGDAAVFLWACKGMSISFRLYVGSKYQTIEKTYNGRVPFGTRRFVFLKDQINRHDDTLTVSVEVLESHRMIEHCIEVPPDPEMPEGVDPPERALDGLVHFHRTINNRLYDQVKHQVDLMRARMVRRIEWKVEQASRLRPCFPTGDCICSTQFNAAGLEGLQLLFYPSGYNGATDGYCSLYVYGPAGCTLKCVLWLGQQKREAHHAFTEPGAFGRTNFCRFEQAVEDDDTVLVALDIEEAHQDFVAQAAHPIVTPGDKRTQGQITGSNSSPVTSVVKLQQVPGRKVEGLEDVRVLPSLWTAYFQDSITQPPDGMHSFDELKTIRKSGRRAGGRASSPQSPGLKGSESMPSLTNGSGRGLDETTPLPRLASTTGGASFGASVSPGGQRTRRPRRTGGMASTTSQLGIAAC